MGVKQNVEFVLSQVLQIIKDLRELERRIYRLEKDVVNRDLHTTTLSTVNESIRLKVRKVDLYNGCIEIDRLDN